MGQVIRVSLPGYDAGTDTNVDHFALYSDQDNILIKEKARGTVNIPNGSTGTISHNLGYIPLFFVYSQTSPTRYRVQSAYDALGANWKVSMGTDTLSLQNNYGTAGTTSYYYIFYDNFS